MVGKEKKSTIRDGNVTYTYNVADTKFASRYRSWARTQKSRKADMKAGGTQYDFLLRHIDTTLTGVGKVRRGSKNRKGDLPAGHEYTHVVIKIVEEMLEENKLPKKLLIKKIGRLGDAMMSWKNKGGNKGDPFALDPALIMFTDRKRIKRQGEEGYTTTVEGKVYGHYKTKNYAKHRKGVSAVDYVSSNVNAPKSNHPLHRALFDEDEGLAPILQDIAQTIKDASVSVEIKGRSNHLSMEETASRVFKLSSVRRYLEKVVNNQTFFRRKSGQIMISKVRTDIQTRNFPIKTEKDREIVQSMVAKNEKDEVAGKITEFTYSSMGTVALLHLMKLAVDEFAKKKVFNIAEGKNVTLPIAPDDFIIWSKGARNAFDYRLTRKEVEFKDTTKKPEDRKLQNDKKYSNTKVISKRDWRGLLKNG